MSVQIKINPNGENVSWSINFTHLMIGVYRAVLLDSSNIILEKWDDQRSDDNLPDKFTLKTPANKLRGCVLWWQAIVMDPSNQGGPYVGTVTIEQDDTTIGVDSSPRNVPSGKGSVDLFSDEISFI